MERAQKVLREAPEGSTDQALAQSEVRRWSEAREQAKKLREAGIFSGPDYQEFREGLKSRP